MLEPSRLSSTRPNGVPIGVLADSVADRMAITAT
jgi:hypothetical protein